MALSPGALLVLYTDGLTEATRNLLEGESSLREALVNPICVGGCRICCLRDR
ncbi:MAG: serine/threonine-protein phosphatase [Candidatus Eremiobacteraeota bacterium]|nr:serine/threonine-protein phosphatase [Candidatus Eremiobacteraeota bacterium]